MSKYYDELAALASSGRHCLFDQSGEALIFEQTCSLVEFIVTPNYVVATKYRSGSHSESEEVMI